MLANPNPVFQSLINKLLIGKRYIEALKRGEELYHIRQFRVRDLTPIEVTSMYYHIKNKFYDKGKICQSESWFQNQLRIFIWLLVGYYYVEEKEINNMKIQDWLKFSKVFNERSPDIFEFQGMSILKKGVNKCQRWSYAQSSLLEEIIRNKETKNKWNQIARELYIISSKEYFRTAKQCRQHWINHLDPSTLRTNWTLQQDYNLVQSITKFGKKWSKISKIFGGRRTQHMVKNRFKSLIHFLKKKHENSINHLNQKKLIQMLVDDLSKRIKDQVGLHQLFKPKQIEANRVIQLHQIQSAVLPQRPQRQFQLPNLLQSPHLDGFGEYHQSSINNIQLNNLSFTHKQLGEDFSIFLHSQNNKCLFEDCLNLFVSEDFKKFQDIQQ